MAIQKGESQQAPLAVVAPMSRLSEQVARPGRMAWHRFTRVEPERNGKLTPREREILGCFAEGLGTAAIASRLSISRTTVRNHTQRILAKLDVHTRLAAVARGYANGLIAIPRQT
jgi:DNA-binding NarL/FixJ family response regulator